MQKMSATVLPMPNVKDSVLKKNRIREWLFNRAIDMGYIEMNDSQPKPSGYNATMILCTLMIIVAMVILVYFTYQTAYKQAQIDIEQQNLKQRLEKAEADAKKAKELQLYNDGANEQKNGEHKK